MQLYFKFKMRQQNEATVQILELLPHVIYSALNCGGDTTNASSVLAGIPEPIPNLVREKADLHLGQVINSTVGGSQSTRTKIHTDTGRKNASKIPQIC